MAVYDVVTYNGEADLFEIRYNILKDYVDEFRVVEFDKTFSGIEKQYYTLEMIGKWPKVKFYQRSEIVYNKYKDLALSSPNTEYGKGAEHWIREFCQKESIKDCLTDLKDNDVVFVGDCDEIVDPLYYHGDFKKILKFKLRVYTYWLNNLSNEDFWGPIRAKYKDIKNSCLNHLRSSSQKTKDYCGWHFTSMGGYENVKNKLTDSYTEESYAKPEVLNNLEQNINANRDFLGRRFLYIQDETSWPSYLQHSKAKYGHLLK